MATSGNGASTGQKIIGAVILIGAFFALVRGCDNSTPSKQSNASPAQQATDDTDEADKDDVLKNKQFLAKEPKYPEGIRVLITANGYECPALVNLWVKGESPYGMRLEALCGPADGSGNAYPMMHYAVYPERLKVNVCEKFGLFSGDCV